MPRTLGHFFRAQSLPSRGAWIEIFKELFPWEKFLVAPLTGSVD